MNELHIGAAVEKKDYQHPQQTTTALWKAVVLGVVFVAAAYGLGYTVHNFFDTQDGVTLSWGIPAVIGVGLFLLIGNVALLIVHDKKILSLFSVLGGLGVLIGFYPSFSWLQLVGGAVITLTLLWAGFAGYREMEKSLQIRFFHASKLILSKMILGVAILGALLVFNVFSVLPLEGENPFLPQSWFETAAETFSGALFPILGDIDFSLTLRETVTKSIEENIEQAPIPVAAQQQLVDRTMNEIQNRIVETFGRRMNPDIKLSSAFYTLLLDSFNGLDESLRRVILAGLAFALFLMLQALSPIVQIVIAVIAFGCYEVLRATGFVGMLYENRSKEQLFLP